MDDVTRALEMAAEGVQKASDAAGYWMASGEVYDMALAAVLAFLKAMPDFNLNASGEWHLLYTPSTITAAIEETQG